MPDDVLRISGLKIETTIGVYDWERSITQPLTLDIHFAVDVKKIAKNDDLAGTVDYEQLADGIREFAANQSCQLIETLAENIATFCLEHYDWPWVSLCLHKSHALGDRAQDISIQIERRRTP